MYQTSDFKKLDVWNKSIELCEKIYFLVKKLPKEETFDLGSQMRRAAISVPSNIAEGHGRGSNKDFIRFLSIARGSLCEIETQCIIATRIGLFNTSDIQEILNLCGDISRMLRSLINYLNKLSQ